MEIRVLGSVELHAGGQVVAVGPPQQRLVLAALAADAGRVLSAETLIDRIWDEAPLGARRTLQVHLTHIRRLLERAGLPEGLVRRSGGYVLQVEAHQVDLSRYTDLVAQARDPNRTDLERAELLREALDLWHGEPLAGLAGPWATRTRAHLRQQHLDTAIAWAATELGLGNGDKVIGRLDELLAENPLAEPVAALLMRALHASGHTARALDHYTAIRERLADELGIDPGAELRQVHQAVLRGEVGPAAIVPSQLPLAAAGFVGRSSQLAHLDRLLSRRDSATGPTVVALSGTAGVGKTALAVNWAHHVRDRFPDGQLYVNLRGFSPTGPMPPAEAVRGFLHALQVPPDRLSAGFAEQTNLYRSVLADKRVLVVLDNARDADQVRPLLPGSPGCLAIVTSRNPLTSLVANYGAHPVSLDILSDVEARQLIAQRLGRDRASQDPGAVQEIIARCAGLPLALTIVAARAATHSGFPLSSLAAELSTDDSRLDMLAGDDPAADVRAVFSWSYHTLGTEAAQLFRLLGLHPGPDITAPAAASLAGLPLASVRAAMAELTRTHLMVEHLPGRYTFHDLLRAYAADLAREQDSEEQRQAAVQRLLDHYLHTAYAAARLFNPARSTNDLPAPRPGVQPERLADDSQALAWFTTERTTLLAAVEHAARTKWDAHTWQLAWTLTDFLDRRGHWHDWIATAELSVAAADRSADITTRATAHRDLARAYHKLDRFEEVHNHLNHALDLYRLDGDQAGQAKTHHSFSRLWERQGRFDAALEHCRAALELYQVTGDQVGQARSLNNMGWCHAHLGNYEPALTACQQALAMHQELGDMFAQSVTWDSIGFVYDRMGDHEQAIECYQQSLALHPDGGDRYFAADTLAHIGDAYHAIDDHAAARQSWQKALDILTDLGHPDTDKVRAKLKD